MFHYECSSRRLVLEQVTGMLFLFQLGLSCETTINFQVLLEMLQYIFCRERLSIHLLIRSNEIDKRTFCSTFTYSYVKHLHIVGAVHGEGAEVVSFYGNQNS